MFRTTFTKVLYQKRSMILFWFLGVMAMSLLTMSVYHAFQPKGTEDIFKNLPPALQKVVGNTNSFKTISGYVAQQIFALRAPMLLTILAITLFSGTTTGDEQKGITETQLSLPISRTRLMLEKFLAASMLICVVSLGFVVGVEIALAFLGEHYGLFEIFKQVLNVLLLVGVFGAFSCMLGAATGKKGLSLGLASGVAFLSYLVSSMASAVSLLHSIDVVSPFHYYVADNPLQLQNIMVLCSLIGIFLIAGLIGFNHRDLKFR